MRWLAIVVAALLSLALPLQAQTQRETERRLQQAQRELDAVSAQTRRLEGQRGEAARELRRLDERVSASVRALRETEARLREQQAQLEQLGQRRDEANERLSDQRAELASLLRSAYTLGDEATLKLILAQDRVSEANRNLAYHGYLQRERARRVASLTTELAELELLEQEIVRRTEELDATRENQRTQLAALEDDRRSRSEAVARLEGEHAGSRERQQALGRDVQAIERTLEQLRAAARRAAEAERRAAQAAASRPGAAPRRPAVAAATPIAVGGLSWPVAGSLLAGFGARMPDGRNSSGVLIAAVAGTPVQAVADGTVVFAEWMTGYGLIIILDHGNDHMSLYAHNDALLRNAGDRVRRGDTIASVGTSGGHGQPALYFELRRAGQPVNPRTWLERR